MAAGDPAEWSGGRPLRSFPVADFSDLAAASRRRPVAILDVRRNLEWADSHLDGAIHIPLHQLPGRLAELPEGELWVYCRTGYRATVAASMLEAAGRAVVAIDDDYDQAATASLPMVIRCRLEHCEEVIPCEGHDDLAPAHSAEGPGRRRPAVRRGQLPGPVTSLGGAA
jgi:rhodanese-related sulfurtransferase